MMRLLVFSLTGMAVVLFIAQFFNTKGTRSHIARGMAVGFLSLAVVIINTVDISLEKGLTWDIPFLTHTLLGTLFFIGLGTTSVFGHLAKNNKALARQHGLIASLTAVFLSLTLSAAILIRFFR